MHNDQLFFNDLATTARSEELPRKGMFTDYAMSVSSISIRDAFCIVISSSGYRRGAGSRPERWKRSDDLQAR